MFDTDHATLIVGVVALAVVAPLAAGAGVPAAQNDRPTQSAGLQSASTADGPAQTGQGVGVGRLSAETVMLRNVTATDVVVRDLTVRRMGQHRNVTFANVSLDRVVVQRANLSDVQIRDATIRSRELLSALGIPFGGFNLSNRSVRRVTIRNRTVDGVVVRSLTVRSAPGLNLSNTESVAGDAAVNVSSPALTAGNVTVSQVRSFQVSVAGQPPANATAEAARLTGLNAETAAESA
ncbi:MULTISPECIES: hypothetical protein [Halorussus]|uniref:hypothetical protein n=1 Tax=Halorussus TaxID=1070314 RepID=UPI0020A1F258|nr:hypothetical protein [Halorussus vallis]USZ75511.1 hypothetical protein NGM07_19025 [Halorussus vallis]